MQYSFVASSENSLTYNHKMSGEIVFWAIKNNQPLVPKIYSMVMLCKFSNVSCIVSLTLKFRPWAEGSNRPNLGKILILILRFCFYV